MGRQTVQRWPVVGLSRARGMVRSALAAGFAIALLGAIGCQRGPTTQPEGREKQPPEQAPELTEDAYPGQLRPMSEVSENFVLRQQLRGEAHGRRFRGETVLQKQGDTLTLVGLSPFGTRAFTLIQRGDEVEYTEHMPQPLPFPARFMLIDIHRTLFVGLDGPRDDGEHTGVVGDENVREHWAAGKLHTRVFTRVAGSPKGAITVTYEGGYRPGEAPPTIGFDNRWFGYKLTIETLMYQQID